MNKILKISLIVILLVFIVGCTIDNPIEMQSKKRNALNYFSKKYNIKKSKIHVELNRLNIKNHTCYSDAGSGSCGDNFIRIKYKGKLYDIKEYEKDGKKYYVDDFQANKIADNLEKLIQNKFYKPTETNIDNLRYNDYHNYFDGKKFDNVLNGYRLELKFIEQENYDNDEFVNYLVNDLKIQNARIYFYKENISFPTHEDFNEQINYYYDINDYVITKYVKETKTINGIFEIKGIDLPSEISVSTINKEPYELYRYDKDIKENYNSASAIYRISFNKSYNYYALIRCYIGSINPTHYITRASVTEQDLIPRLNDAEIKTDQYGRKYIDISYYKGRGIDTLDIVFLNKR